MLSSFRRLHPNLPAAKACCRESPVSARAGWQRRRTGWPGHQLHGLIRQAKYLAIDDRRKTARRPNAFMLPFREEELMHEQVEVVYENGVFRPLGVLPGQFQEHQHLTVTIENHSGDEGWLAAADPTVSLEAVRRV